MSEYTDLIERLKGPFNYAPRKRGEPHLLMVPEQLIEDCSRALEAPLPDDVAEVIDGMRAMANEHGVCDEWADMIERLWRQIEIGGMKDIDSMREIDPHVKPASQWVIRVIIIGTLALIALNLLVGCGMLTPMPENQIAPYIEWEKTNEMDTYITNYCSAYS